MRAYCCEEFCHTHYVLLKCSQTPDSVQKHNCADIVAGWQV